MTLALARCFAHPARGASSRCCACTRFCCSECGTEHAGRLLCCSCLERTLADVETSAPPRAWPYVLAAIVNLFVAYELFHGAGTLLGIEATPALRSDLGGGERE